MSVAPDVSPERPTSGLVRGGPAPGFQYWAAGAYDGTNYLAVWLDERIDASSVLRAAVIDEDGAMVMEDIVVSPADPFDARPAVGFDGVSFLVAWGESDASPGIYAKRLSTAGVVLDASPITLSTEAEFAAPRVACDGTNCLVVWGEAGDVRGARVSQAGVVLDPGGFIVSEGGGPDVAFDGTNYLVVWSAENAEGRSEIHGQRVSQAGAPLGSSAAIATVPEGSEEDLHGAVVAFGGGGYLVAWTNEDFNNEESDVYGRRVGTDGVPVGAGPFVITAEDEQQRGPVVGFDGTNFVVSWSDLRDGFSLDLFAARVSTAGTVLDADGVALTLPSQENKAPTAVVASNAAPATLVLWDTEADVFAARLNGTLAIVDRPFIVSRGINGQEGIAVGFDGTNYLAVWQDTRNGFDYDIYASRLSQAGMLLDPEGIPIATTPGHPWTAAVAFDGTNYLIVWAENASGARTELDMYAARLTPNGVLLDEDPLVLSDAADDQDIPAVAFDGDNYLVVWGDERGADSDVYGTRVSPAGTVLDPAGFPIASGPGFQEVPAVACGAINCLVTWGDPFGEGRRRIAASALDGVDGALVDGDGDVVDVINVSPGAAEAIMPSVAFDGTNYLAVWIDRAGEDVYGARISQAGAKVGPGRFRVSPTAGVHSETAVAYTGTQYLVFWQHLSGRIEMSRVTRGGVALDLTPIRVASSGCCPVAATSGPAGEAALAYLRWPEASPFLGWTARAFVRYVDDLDTAAPQTRIAAGPSGRRRARNATFRFTSSEALSRFQCRLDSRRWRNCSSPRTHRNLGPGRHAFRVRAIDQAGNRDQTPALRRWRIVRR